MPSEKFFVHKEDGSLVRLKGRLVRFLDEEPPTGSDKSAIRTALEVSPDAEGLVQADVGTGPQNLVLHQHLGTLAYANADGVSVASLEVTGKVDGSLGIGVTPDKPLHVGGSGEQTLRLENTSDGLGDGSVVGSIEFEANDSSTNGSGVVSKIQSESLNATGNLFGLSFHTGHGGSMTEKMLLDNDGRLGIGTSSMSTYNSNANNLVVGSGSGSEGLTIASGTTGEGGIYFADGTTGNQQYRGYLGYGHTNDELFFGTDGETKWKLNTTGNLVPQSSGLGIDFGSTTTGTGTVATNGGLLNDYEFGTFTVTTNGDATGAFASQLGEYTKIGRLVNVRIIFAVNTDFTSNKIGGLPFTVNSLGTGASSVASGSIALTSSATDSPVTCHTNRSATTVSFSVGTSVGITHAPNTTNSTYRLQFSYHTDD